MTPSAKPTIPDVLERFRAYHAAHPAWGALHIVLDDWNVADADVQYCRHVAAMGGDREGAELAEILLTMSRTQRLRLAQLA